MGVNARLAVAFATPVCSQAVLHLVFKQLLVYYSRFLVIIEKRYGTGQARGRGACSARGSPDLTSSGGAARTAPRGGGGAKQLWPQPAAAIPRGGGGPGKGAV